MTSADGDGEGVNSGPGHELLGLCGIGVDDLFEYARDAGLGTTNRAKFTLDADATRMS